MVLPGGARLKRLWQWGLSAVVALNFLAPLLWMLLASLYVEARIFQTAPGAWWDRTG